MKIFRHFLVTAFVALSAMANASEPTYFGLTLGHYILDNDRAIEGDFEGSNMGIQLGKFLSPSTAIEFGYGANIDHDDFDVATLAGLLYLNEDQEAWRPYLIGGFNMYDFNETSNLVSGHDDRSSQAFIGLGVAKLVGEDFQFRADVRGMGGLDEDGEDLGFQLSFNKLFGRAAPPAAQPEPQPAPAPAPAPVQEEPETRTITIRLNVEFEFNKATVLAVYGDQLQAIAAAMKTHEDIELVLEGHTDSRGADDYNQDLSDRRAQAVKAKLVEDYGIPAGRISAVGYGESRPIATNETDEGRARNRRVVGEMSFSEVLVD